MYSLSLNTVPDILLSSNVEEEAAPPAPGPEKSGVPLRQRLAISVVPQPARSVSAAVKSR